MTSDDQKLFATTGNSVLKGNGHLKPHCVALAARVNGVLDDNRDDDDERLTVVGSELRNLDGLGFVAATDFGLFRMRELERAAEAVRTGRAARTRGVLTPQYTLEGGLRSFGPNLDTYRAQPVRMFRARPGHQFVAGRVPALGLGVLSKLRWPEDPVDDRGEPSDGPWNLFGEPALCGLDPYAVLAAAYHLKREGAVTRDELTASAPDSDLLARIKSLAGSGHECAGQPATEVRAAVETLLLGLDDSARKRVIEHEFGITVTIRCLRELDDAVAQVLGFHGAFDLDDRLERAAKLFGVDFEAFHACLWRLSRGGTEGGYEALLRPPSGRVPSRKEWDELRRLTRLTEAPPDDLRHVLRTAGRQLMLDIKGEPVSPGSALRVLELLSGGTSHRGRPWLRVGLRAPGESSGGQTVGPAYPTGLRRAQYLQGRYDVMLAIADGLRTGGYPLAALTRNEFLLEVHERAFDLDAIQDMVAAAVKNLLGPVGGRVEVGAVKEW